MINRILPCCARAFSTGVLTLQNPGRQTPAEGQRSTKLVMCESSGGMGEAGPEEDAGYIFFYSLRFVSIYGSALEFDAYACSVTLRNGRSQQN